MNLKGTKFVRFDDWRSERSTSSEREFSTDNGRNPRRARPSLNAVLSSIRRGFDRGSDRFKTVKKPLSPSKQPAKEPGPRKNILDPQGSFLQTWNKIFVISCVIAVSLDPLFLYTSVVDGKNKCLGLDKELQIVACVLRSFTDVFHILHIIFQFRTGFIAPSSRVFGRGELNDDPVAIAKRYLCSYFIIDVLAILPLPQVVVFLIVPIIERPVPMTAKNLLTIVIVCQYVPRLIRIYPLYKEVTKTSGFLTEIAWAATAFNLLLYMLASHVVGALWYLFSVEREYRCWHDHCGHDVNCKKYLYCGDSDKVANMTIVDMLKDSCPFTNPDDIKDSSVFNFGIFAEALESGVMETTDFPMKFLYCFWWGLRSLRNEIAKTSSDAEQWMSHRMLPEKLRERIRRYDQYKWQETRGVEEDELVRNLPKDLRKDIKRHLCLALVKRVPMFEKMDDRLMDALCDHLKPVLFTDDSFIIREGDPVDEMLFVMRGNLATMTTNGGRTGFFNCANLKAGDFCGEELLTWALDPKSTTNLPISTRTVEAITEVEAFALRADDLKFVASQFRRLHSRQVQHAFRIYILGKGEDVGIENIILDSFSFEFDLCKEKLHDAFASDAGTTPSLVATIYASRFAANALRAVRQKDVRDSRPLPALLPLLPQKPAEPDFTEEEQE
ncbi:hypothetical protein ACLB2K_076574 [Fragaria x ananassa]